MQLVCLDATCLLGCNFRKRLRLATPVGIKETSERIHAYTDICVFNAKIQTFICACIHSKGMQTFSVLSEAFLLKN
jgi:hypothetical protein